MTSKERIIIAAQELFFRNGIRSVTMDDIARHMGISKKTLYRFFKDKDRIVNQLCKNYLKNRLQTFGCVKDQSLDAVHEILQTMSMLAEMFKSINPKLFYDLQKYHPVAWAQFRSFKEDCIQTMVEENIRKGIKQGHFRKEINTKLLAKLRIEEVEMAMNPDTFPPEQYNLAEVQLGLLDHFLHGITTLKGHQLIGKYKSSMKL